MSTITAILEPNADGTVHLPLPAELRHGKVRVEAKLEAASAEQKTPEPGGLKGFGALKGKIWMAPDFDEPLEDFKNPWNEAAAGHPCDALVLRGERIAERDCARGDGG